MPYFRKAVYFGEIIAILPVTREFGFKRNPGRFSMGQEALKTIFDCGGQGCYIISDYIDHQEQITP